MGWKETGNEIERENPSKAALGLGINLASAWDNECALFLPIDAEFVFRSNLCSCRLFNAMKVAIYAGVELQSREGNALQNSPKATSEMIVYRPPTPLRASKMRVWSFAEHARAELKVSSGFDLAALVENNGGRIKRIGPFDPDQTDAIRVEPDGAFEIRLSSLTGTLRDHFTMAHEIGHLMLHWPIVKKAEADVGMRATRFVDPDEPDLIRCEWEANWFASAFLMPREEFGDTFKQGGEEAAAARFGVSPAAVKVRARTLGIGK